MGKLSPLGTLVIPALGTFAIYYSSSRMGIGIVPAVAYGASFLLLGLLALRRSRIQRQHLIAAAVLGICYHLIFPVFEILSALGTVHPKASRSDDISGLFVLFPLLAFVVLCPIIAFFIGINSKKAKTSTSET